MEISTAEINSFTDVLFKKYGLDFTCYEPKSLERRIKRVLHVLKCPSVMDLWLMILKDNSLLQNFMDELSVGLTGMFRDPHMWSTLRSLLFDYDQSEITIWNAGCSTGEEVYTLSIVLQEMNLTEKVKIIASDMNKTALETARNGVYHKIKMADYDKKYLEYNKFGNFQKYYSTHDSSHYKMNSDLIKNVNFKYHNLITDAFIGQFDFVFCRNVMIYFDAISKNEILKKYYSLLKPGGYLILGFYDSLLPIEEKSKYNVELSHLRIFKKKSVSREQTKHDCTSQGYTPLYE